MDSHRLGAVTRRAHRRVAGIHARKRGYGLGQTLLDDFRILVPIWGKAGYLQNVPYLSQYGSKVTLCTTGDETDEFYAELEQIAATHGFRVFRDEPDRNGQRRRRRAVKQRATSGTIRDRVIRNVLAEVTEAYVVPLDADTTTREPVSLLVGELGSRAAGHRVDPPRAEQS